MFSFFLSLSIRSSIFYASLPAELTLSWFLSCCTSSLIKLQIYTSHTSGTKITQLLLSEADKMLLFDWGKVSINRLQGCTNLIFGLDISPI